MKVEKTQQQEGDEEVDVLRRLSTEVVVAKAPAVAGAGLPTPPPAPPPQPAAVENHGVVVVASGGVAQAACPRCSC